MTIIPPINALAGWAITDSRVTSGTLGEATNMASFRRRGDH